MGSGGFFSLGLLEYDGGGSIGLYTSAQGAVGSSALEGLDRHQLRTFWASRHSNCLVDVNQLGFALGIEISQLPHLTLLSLRFRRTSAHRLR